MHFISGWKRYVTVYSTGVPKCKVYYAIKKGGREISFRHSNGLRSYCKYSPFKSIFNLVIFFSFHSEGEPPRGVKTRIFQLQARDL